MRGPDAARLGLGLLCLARPDVPPRLVRAEHAGRGIEVGVRVLGARYVVQSLGGPWLHRSWVPGVDIAVDLVHAASMLALAPLAPKHKRVLLGSAAVATAFAVADARHPETSADHR